MKRVFAPSEHEALQACIALEVILAEAEISVDYRKIVGKKFVFFCEHGSHTRTLVGTITAVEYSDEGGLELYVGNPTFWGTRLICLRWSESNQCWCAHIEDQEKEEFIKRAARESDNPSPLITEDVSNADFDLRVKEHIDSLIFPGRLILL